MCIIVENESDVAAFKDYVDTSTPSKPISSAAAVPPPPSAPSPVAPLATAAPPPRAASSSPITSLSGVAGRLFASPLAKKLASEKGVNLGALQGSGPGGRIIAQDVQGAPAGVGLGAMPSMGSFTDAQISGMRQVIAKRLLQSKQTIPHYYLSVEVEMESVLKYIKWEKEKTIKNIRSQSIFDFTD